jgi:hypothetical protein
MAIAGPAVRHGQGRECVDAAGSSGTRKKASTLFNQELSLTFNVRIVRVLSLPTVKPAISLSKSTQHVEADNDRLILFHEEIEQVSVTKMKGRTVRRAVLIHGSAFCIEILALPAGDLLLHEGETSGR